MPLIPLKSIPPGRIEDSNPGIPGFRSAAAEAGSAGTLFGFGKTPENRLLGIIVGVYAGVSMLAGFITHRLGGFSAQDTLTYSTINVFSGISVILLGVYVIYRYNLLGDRVSFRGWMMAILAMATLHLVLQLIGFNYIKNKPELFPRGGGTYAAITFFVRGAAILVAVLVYEAVLRWRRFRQKQDEVLRLALLYKDSELSRLRAQLNPHFLFNSLGAIAADSDRPKVVELLVSSLADVLRYNLSGTESSTRFSKETHAVQSYLRMEQARLGEMLTIEINIPVAAELCLVPQPLLLPLIENGIKYGLATSGDFLSLKVGAEVSADRLSVWVENSGKWVPPEPSEVGRQIGLANLRRRLDLHFGPGDYVACQVLPESVRVSVIIPIFDTETSPNSHRRR